MVPPQLSEMTPQFSSLQASSAVNGVQVGGAPQKPGMPPSPQISPSVQAPQCSTPPQPLPVSPHSTPAVAQSGIKAGQLLSSPVRIVLHWNACSMPQPCPSGQVPHETVPSQPSPSMPHSLPAQTSSGSAGTHRPSSAVHTFGVTMPHDEPSAQVPQSSRLPQPSAT